MAEDVGLPPGFVLDQSAPPPASPSLPPGFVVDQQAPPAPAGGPPLNSLQDYGKSVYGFEDYPKRGTILPIGEDKEGNLHLAMPQIGIDALDSLLLPGFAAKGGQYTPQDTLGLAGMISPVSAAARVGKAAGFDVLGSTAAKPKVPTTAELKTAASKGYDAARDMGVTYTSDSVKNMADDITQSLNQDGRIGELNPELFALLGKLQNPPPDSFVTLDSLQALRKRLGDIRGSPDNAKSAAAGIAQGKLDRFLETGGSSGGSRGVSAADNPAAGAGASGTSAAEGSANPGAASDLPGASPADQIAQILKTARGNSAAAFRAQDLADLRDVTDLRTDATNSGHNLGNKIRQRLASLLASDSQSRGYSPQELDAMRAVVQGTPATNTLREVSNRLGGGGGLGQTFLAAAGGGAAALGGYGPEGVMLGASAPAAVGSITRALGNFLTNKQLVDLEKQVRKRSPLYADRAANPGAAPRFPIPASIARRLALTRALQGYQDPNAAPVGADLSPDM